jgi:hypothetical protein
MQSFQSLFFEETCSHFRLILFQRYYSICWHDCTSVGVSFAWHSTWKAGAGRATPALGTQSLKGDLGLLLLTPTL